MNRYEIHWVEGGEKKYLAFHLYGVDEPERFAKSVALGLKLGGYEDVRAMRTTETAEEL